MSWVGQDILLGQVPEQVRAPAHGIGLRDENCLFSLRSDLALDGSVREVWFLVGRDQVVALPSEPLAEEQPRPVSLSKATKVRSFQTVGSAFLQLMVDGIYVDIVRYSNARREMFDRVRVQLERMIAGEPLVEEALRKPSERICDQCGMPLPVRKATCPRCNARSGIFRRTLGLMRPYRHFVLMLLGMMVLGVSLDLIPPQLTRVLVDKVLKPTSATAEAKAPATDTGFAEANAPAENKAANAANPVALTAAERAGRIHLLSMILLALVATSASRHLLNIFIGRTSSLIGTRITRELRERLQQKLVGASVDYYDRHSVGSLMSRVLYDVDYFQGFVVQVAHGFLLNIMLVLGIGTTLFFMNARLAVLVLLPIPLVIIGTTFFWKHIYPRYYRLWDSQSKMAQLLTGLLSGIRLVKVFGQERREHERFGEAAGYMQVSRRSVEMSVSTFNPIMAFIFGLGGLIVWYAGGQRVLGSEMTLGTLMAFFGYLGMFYAPISALSMFSNWVTGFLTAGQRVFEVLDVQPSVREDAAPVHIENLRGDIEFRNVTFGYDPHTPIIKRVSLKIKAGQFIGIVGKSGSGKTTLVNLICRFYDVQEGEVLIDGVDVHKFAQEDLHRQVALVLQEPFLFRASIAENIAYGRPDAAPMAIADAARAANAHDFITRLPGGYDTRLGERGAGLSGGERQRVSIARALLCDPRVLILDEATSSVDTESEQEIQKALAVLGRGRTIIAIAHRLSTLKNSDYIYVIDDGAIAESGSHEELLAKEGIYHNLVRIQTELTRLEM